MSRSQVFVLRKCSRLEKLDKWYNLRRQKRRKERITLWIRVKLQTNRRDSDNEGGQETNSRISEYTRHMSTNNHSICALWTSRRRSSLTRLCPFSVLDIILLATSKAKLQERVDRLDRVSRDYSLLINVDKTKLMASDVPHTHSEWTTGADGYVPVPWVPDYRRWWVYDGIPYR